MRGNNMLLFASLLTLAFTTQSTARERPSASPPAGSVSCIDPQQITARHAQPPGAIMFEMSGGITYRNDVIGACPGIARADSNSIVQFETGGTRLCADDSVRVYDPVEARGVGARAFARCRLGRFTPVPSD